MEDGPNIKNPINLLTFGTFHNSNMQISDFDAYNDFY